MPNKKISELPAAGALTGAEMLPLVQGGVTKRSTTGAVAAAAVVRCVEVVCDPAGTTLSTGDGKADYTIPLELNGMVLLRAHAALSTVSSAGLPTIQIANVATGFDMLTTKITIDVGEFTSYTAATPPVVDGAHSTVSTGDLVRIDCDVAGTGAKGLRAILSFQTP